MATGDFLLDLKAILNTKDINNQLKTISKTQKIHIDATGTEKVVKEVSKWQDGNNKIISQTKTIDKNTGQLSTTLKTVNTSAQKLNQSFGDIVLKVSKFLLATTVISGFTTAIYGAIQETKKLDSSLVELRKVSDLGGRSLKNYTEQAYDLAEVMSTTASNVVDASTEFAKSGYSIEESMKLAETALKFQTIADGAISASDSATMLIQTMKAYNLTAQDSEKIINSINSVSNQYAVSSTDLSSAIGRVASTANLAGVDLDHLLGLITASNEIVQNAGKVANGYKTILTNLMTKDLEDQFNAFGLTMRDQNGMLKDGYTLIKELAGVYKGIGEVWDGDTESMVSLNDQMNKLLQDIAGKYNINTLVAGLNGFDQAIKATETSINSAGSANEEYATALDSIEKKLEGIRGQFQQLVTQGGLGDFIKLVLDAGTAILKFANSDIGQTIIKITALIGVSTLLVSSFGKITLGVKALTTAMKLNPLLFGAQIVIAGLVLAKKASDDFAQSIEDSVGVVTKSHKEIKEDIKGVNEAFQETESSVLTNASLLEKYIGVIENLTGKTKLNSLEQAQLKNALDGINNIMPDLNLAYDNETGKLNTQISVVKSLATQYRDLALAKAFSTKLESQYGAKIDLELRHQSVSQQIKQLRQGLESGELFGLEKTRAQGLIQKLYKEQSDIQKSFFGTSRSIVETQKLMDEYMQSYRQNVTDTGADVDKLSGKIDNLAGVGGDISGVTASVDALKDLHSLFQDILSDMEHELFLATKRGATEQERISMMENIQKEIERQSNYYRSKGLDDNHEYIQSLQKQWQTYKDNIINVQKEILNETIEQQNNVLKAFNMYAQEQQKNADIQIKKLQDELSLIDQQNNAYEKSIELMKLQEALARAQSQKVRVYEEGKGFVYRQDISAVGQAQDALNEYNRQQSVEAEKNRVQDKIDAWQREKDKWSELVSNFSEKQSKMELEMELGASIEETIFGKRLQNITNFTNAYLSNMQKLVNAQSDLNALSSGKKPSSSGGSGDGVRVNKPGLGYIWTDKASADKIVAEGGHYAKGIKAVPYSQFSEVGENGNEMIIAPHTNMGLPQGAGVVPKTMTENLMDIGRFSLVGLKNFVSGNNQGETSVVNNFDKIVLPNVTDAQSFVTELKNFKNLATQTAFART